MVNALIHMFRLTRAGIIFLRHGVHVVPPDVALPGPLRFLQRRNRRGHEQSSARNAGARLTEALTKLGPSYVKLGQFLATRPDIVGAELALNLSQLQDRLPPFPTETARREVEEALGSSVDKLFVSFSDPIAAASIAQVHKASVHSATGGIKPVAVKVLRPGVERRFQRDLATFYFAARQAERWHAPLRRLRPVAVVDTLASWVKLEMDLRFEAAALSEMAENIAKNGDDDFRVPEVDWSRTARRVLTTEWIDAIPISDLAAIERTGLDRAALGNRIIRTFLRHAMRDGFFHADMHPGNLFVDPDGKIVAVDFGIMGRLGPKERRFLAEILYGFLTRSYRRIAEVHFDAGYVPPDQDVAAFAQALRSIGEPIHDRTAEDISMGRLLSQLFQVTELFDMQTRPELLLLQKTMVVTEGVARMLDPRLNMWEAAEPVVREWMERELGSGARIREAAEGAATLAGLLAAAPKLAEQAGRVGQTLTEMSQTGLRLDQPTIERLSEARARRNRAGRLALWLGALALVAIAVKVWMAGT